MTDNNLTNDDNTSKQRTRRRGVLLVSALSVGTLLSFASAPVAAQCAYPEVCVQPVTIEPTSEVPPQAPAPQQPEVLPAVQQPSQLPVTGSDAGVVAASGLLMLGAGMLLTKRASKAPAATE